MLVIPLGAALAGILSGGLLIIRRRLLLAHVVGFLIIENGLFLVLLMIIFLGMGRAVLRMLQSPEPIGASTAAPPERFHIAHAVSFYVLAVSMPIAIFRPAFLFGSLRSILAGFGFAL